MRKGLSWDQFKRKLAAVVVVATLVVPGVASAEESSDAPASDATVTYDSGSTVPTYGPMSYGRGVSWS